jgi:urea transporter
MKKPVTRFIQVTLCSTSQIMLQRSRVVGLLFAVGIAINSPAMLLGATVAIISSLVVAKVFNYASDDIANGLYGYNAALVGVAIFYFFPPNLTSFALVIIAGGFSTLIMHVMLRWFVASTWHFFTIKIVTLPALTAPFVVTIWLTMLLAKWVAIEPLTVVFKEQCKGDFCIVLRGVGQVIFQSYWLSGVIFVVGLFWQSYKVAITAIIGSALGMLIARICNFSDEWILAGAYGFNASLVAIALIDRYPAKQWLTLLGLVMSVLFTRAFEQSALPALTAPFVLASWIIIVLARQLSEKDDSLR